MMIDTFPKCKYMREVFRPDPLHPIEYTCTFKDGNGELVDCIGFLNCTKYAEDLGAFSPEKSTFDPVEHPSHYTEGREYEPKDVIYDWGLDFNLGSAVKYISRAGRKDDIIQDLKKAQQFIQFEIDAIQKKRSKEVQKND